MARAQSSQTHRRHKKVLKMAKGYRTIFLLMKLWFSTNRAQFVEFPWQIEGPGTGSEARGALELHSVQRLSKMDGGVTSYGKRTPENKKYKVCPWPSGITLKL